MGWYLFHNADDFQTNYFILAIKRAFHSFHLPDTSNSRHFKHCLVTFELILIIFKPYLVSNLC